MDASKKPNTADVEAIRRGKGDDPQPVRSGDRMVALNSCPDCKGRGYFLINPFMTGGTNGAGGLGNMCQCLTCLDSESYYRRHGELPPELAIAATKNG